MKVYIELVIIDNFAVTFIISRLVYYFLGEHLKKLRVFSACAVGSLTAVLYPLISEVWLSLIFKVLTGLVLSLILFGTKKLLRGTLYFFLLTFAYGGVLFALGYFLKGSVYAALTEPIAAFPIGVTLVIGYILFIVIKSLVLKLRKSRDIDGFLYDAEIKLFGKVIRCKAFLDSGNRLYDNTNGLPIVIASMGTLSGALDDEHITQLMTGKLGELGGAHYIECDSMGGKSKMPVLRPDELVVYRGDKKNIISDVMLGVAFKRLSDVEGYGLILNPAVF